MRCIAGTVALIAVATGERWRASTFSVSLAAFTRLPAVCSSNDIGSDDYKLAIQSPTTNLPKAKADEVQLAIRTNGCFGHEGLTFE